MKSWIVPAAACATSAAWAGEFRTGPQRSSPGDSIAFAWILGFFAVKAFVPEHLRSEIYVVYWIALFVYVTNLFHVWG